MKKKNITYVHNIILLKKFMKKVQHLANLIIHLIRNI